MIDNLIVEFISIHDLNEEEWNNFLLSTSESTFFCTTDWWRAYNNSFVLQIRNKKKELIAGIPFRILTVIPLIGRFFKFCWLDSSALVNQIFGESEIYELKKMVLKSLIDHLRRSQVIVMLISSKARSHDAALFKELQFSTERSATLLGDITKEENEILKGFSGDKRYSIRRAQKAGIQVKIIEGVFAADYVSDFCKLQKKLFEHKSGSYSDIYYKSESFLNTILSASYSKSYLALAYLNNHPVAVDIVVSYNKLLYYYLGASDYELNKTTGASSLLHYEIIKFAKAKGFETYDFGGIPFNPDKSDSLYGIYNFKKDFGGRRFEYDHGNYVLRRQRYWIIRKLRNYENHPVPRFFYNLLKK